MRANQLVPVLKETARAFGKDKATRLAAALAYYTLFSLAPLLVICIAIAGMFYGDQAAGMVTAQLDQVLGKEGAEGIAEMVANADRGRTGIIATVIGIITLLFGASGVFGQLKDALNTIWSVPERQKTGIIAFIKERFLSMTAVLGVGFLLLVSLVVSTVLSGLGRLQGGEGGDVLWQIVTMIVDLGVVSVAFAFLFRFLPDRRIRWNDVWLGAFFTATLFGLGKFGISMYLGKSALGGSFGAAASLAILLVWLYYSGMIFFFGAEFTEVYSRAKAHAASGATKEGWAVRGAPPEQVSQSPIVHTVSKPSRVRQVPQPVVMRKAGNSKVAMAGAGAAGIFVGAMAASIGAVIMTVKGVKRVIKR